MLSGQKRTPVAIKFRVRECQQSGLAQVSWTPDKQQTADSDAPLAIPRLRSFLLRLLFRLSFFRSHLRLLLNFFIRVASFSHTLRSLFALLQAHYTAQL